MKIFVNQKERYLTEDEAKAVKLAIAKGDGFCQIGKLRIFFDRKGESGWRQ